MFRSPFLTWLKRQSQVSKSRSARAGKNARRGKLCLEALEDRTLLNATVMDVTTSLVPNSIVGSGQTVNVTVDFNEAVDVTGTPTIQLNDSANTAAAYASGSGTTALQFSFVVPAGDTTSGAALDYTSATALLLNSGTINDDPIDGDTNAADLTLPTPATPNDFLQGSNIVIDATTPTVTGVTTTTTAGTYGPGATVSLDVAFSEAVNVDTTNGTPTLSLSDGKSASYTSGSGSNTLVFTYTVGAGDTTSGSPLDVSGLNLNSGTIKNAGGEDANLTLNGDTVPSSNVIIDATTPTVTSVTSPTAAGTYGIGSTITLDVNFSEAVTVDTTNGTPTLSLSDGKSASYTSGSGSNTLVFTYTVGAGDTTSGSPLDVSAINLNSGTIKNAGGVDADLTINSNQVPSQNIVIDATTATVTSVTSSTIAGTYGPGATVTLDVTFSEAVNVTGTPILALSDGGTALYTSGSGTNTLVFTYTVQAGDTTNGSALDVNAIALNTGTIQNAGGVDADLTINSDQVPSQNIVIDATTPAVTAVTSTNSAGAYGTGATIALTVTFGEAVTVDTTNGTPTLTLSDGKTASYTSGSGTTTLTFTYTVQAGDTTNGSALDVSAISLNGGTIKNAGGVSATLALNGDTVPSKNIVIDATTPSAVLVDTATATGTYGPGATITIVVTFSEPVTVTGTPILALSDGGTATYASGSGTSTLTFLYVVQSGDTTNGQPLDFASTTALSLNGGTIQSAGGANATLTLPTPGGVDDFLAQTQIIINASAPTPTPTPTPTPAASIPAQIQRLFQDLISFEINTATGNVPAAITAALDFQATLAALEQEIFQIFLNSLPHV